MGLSPGKALLVALKNMAESRGKGIAGIAKAGGQKRVKINVRALYKYHDEETGYRLVEDILNSIDEKELEFLESHGIKLVKDRWGIYIEVPVEILENPDSINV